MNSIIDGFDLGRVRRLRGGFWSGKRSRHERGCAPGSYANAGWQVADVLCIDRDAVLGNFRYANLSHEIWDKEPVIRAHRANSYRGVLGIPPIRADYRGPLLQEHV